MAAAALSSHLAGMAQGTGVGTRAWGPLPQLCLATTSLHAPRHLFKIHGKNPETDPAAPWV